MREKVDTWTVYTHTSPSGKVYVGISKDLKDRWANKGAKYCTYESIFKYAIAKYGWDNLKHEIILEGITKSEAAYAEKYLIRWYKMHNISYNITDGGDGLAGVKLSLETRQKMVSTRIANNEEDYLVIDKDFNYILFSTTKAAAEFLDCNRANVSNTLISPIGYTYKGYYIRPHKKGEIVDIDSIKEEILAAKKKRRDKMAETTKSRSPELVRLSNAAMARMTSEEKKAKYTSYGMQGKHHSEETKKKISEAAKGRDMSKAIEASRKKPHDYVLTTPVVQFDLEGNYINEFQSVTEATFSLNKTSRAISNCLNGRAKTAFGYRWEYKVMGGH